MGIRKGNGMGPHSLIREPGDPLGNHKWINANIRQNHGPLGAIYPLAAMGVDGLKEGDSPSFVSGKCCIWSEQL